MASLNYHEIFQLCVCVKIADIERFNSSLSHLTWSSPVVCDDGALSVELEVWGACVVEEAVEER